MNSLQAVWNQVEKLLQEGISVIPVRDRDQPPFVAKSPFKEWKEFQTRIVSKEELWAAMEAHNTTAVGTVCGAVSGNLEAIDIDVKYRAGIDAQLFQDIKSIYPDLWQKIRIHKSPSGGFHIIYRLINGTVPGNLKLAGRYATEEELVTKPKNKTYNFIETRGEGGYVLAPPSLGYSVHKNSEIPLLTWEERCSLINLCQSYTEIIKVEPTYKPTKTESGYYDENPFDDYNQRVDPVQLMQAYGWKYYKDNSKFIWFTRPGKDSGISASFNREKRIFYNFTASTELEENHGYNPATLLAQFEFRGDKKRAYSWLVQNGYGKVKPSVEAAQIKKKALAGKPLPANFSEDARNQHFSIQQDRDKKHPYGIFWEQTEKDEKIIIDRVGLYEVAEGLGFRSFNKDLVQVIGHKVYRREERFFFDTVRDYVQEEDGDLYRDICNAYENFIESHGKFTITRLPILEGDTILEDTDAKCYKFYENCYVEITADKCRRHEYSALKGLIWDETIQRREYEPAKPGGLYVDFIKKACANPAAVRKIIGYLSHQFKDETTGYIVVLTEEVPDPKSGGGSGKNLFSKLLQFTTTYLGIPGSQVKFDEKFLQSWNYQKIFAISDVPRKFDFGFLKELSTGVGLLKKLYSNETSVPVELMPKFIIETNYSYEITDGGLKRRLIPIEFTSFFTLSGGVDVHYKKHFPKGWAPEDWHGYDAFIIQCVQEWLAGGRKLSAAELTETGWLKQFEQQYQQLTREFIEENWPQWTATGFVANKHFHETYEKFCVENDINIRYRLSSMMMNRALAAYCEKNNYVFEANVVRKNNGFLERGRQFAPVTQVTNQY